MAGERIPSESSRHVLIHRLAHPRIADLLAELAHPIDVVLWSADGCADADGKPVADPRPEAAWLSIDVLATGEFMAMTDAILGMGSVRWVQGFLAGVDAPPFRKLIDAGIRLSNSDAPNVGVAEYVMSALLAHRHGIAERLENQRTRQWKQTMWPEIGGQRWLVVGFGSIGREIARRARPFGVEIVGLRRTATTDDAADRMATTADLHTELGRADVVILACPLTEETRGLVDRDFLGAMRRGAVLVNVSRGPVVNDAALLAGLDHGLIDAAILDVFEPEPLPADHPYWTHPRVTVTSHVAGAGAGIGPRNDALFIDQLDDYLAGRPLRLEVQA